MQGYAQMSNRQLPMYQEPHLLYQTVSNSHHNPQQAHFNPPPYPAELAKQSNRQQAFVNNWSAHQAIHKGKADGYAPASQRFDGNQTCPQQPLTRHQLHPRPSNVAAHNAKGQALDNPNGHNRHYGQFNTQSNSNVASQQIYKTTETTVTQVNSGQPHAYWTQHSDHRNSETVSNNNTRGLISHISDNGSSCQQLQPRPNHIYPHQPQHFSGQGSGLQTVPKPGRTLHYNPAAQNKTTVQRMINNQAQSTTSVTYTSPNSVTLPPAGPRKNISPPSNNVQQSQPALMSKANPNVMTAQDRHNQNSTGHPTAYANVQTCNVNQNAQNQRVPTSEAQLNPTSRPFNLEAYIKSNLYYILSSNDKELGSKKNHQPSDGRLQNTCLNQSGVRSANSHSQLLSEPNLQCTAEPVHKRMNTGQIQRDYWKSRPSNNTSMPKDSGLQSSLPGTQQMAVLDLNSNGNGQKQIEIQYVTDPAVCLEAVFALQKMLQVHKAVAIVPPISQQPSNTEKVNDACMRTDDSPPLKIDAMWLLAKESQNPEKLSEDSSPTVQEDDKRSLESNTTNAADSCIKESSDTCSDNPTGGCQNQSDCESSEAAFELSNVPMVAYTLGNLNDLINSLEIIESSSQCPKKPKSVCKQILDLYWNGDVGCLKKELKELHKERLYFDVESVKDESSVVFESITPENLKKVAHCEIVTNELCSSFKQYRSSWLNVDGQPADIGKVLLEPLSDYITFSKEASDNICVPADNLGVNSLKDPEVPTFKVNELAEPNSESPESILTPRTGNGRAAIEGHSDVGNPGVEEEAFEQGDNMQNDKHLNTKTSADLSYSKDLRADTTTKENLNQEHIRDYLTIAQKESEPHVHFDSKQLHDKPLQLVDTVSDAVDESLTTKPSLNFTDTWQVEDISDDDCSDDMKAPTNCKHTMQVKNISDDENSNNMEILTNSADTMLVENISNDENSNIMDIFTNSTHTMQVENISDDENSDNMEAVTKSTDRFIVEDISNDENSSDNSLLMDVTVLSSEEALTFFQQLDKETQSDGNMSSTQFNVDRLELVAFSPGQPNHEYNKAEICSSCGINNILTSKIDSDRELFCPSCWDMAPSLKLEMDPCSPKSNETDVLGCEKLEGNCSPSVEMEVLEPVIALTDVRIAEEELNEKSKDDTVENSPEIKSTVEQEIVKIQPRMTKDENSENISIPKLHKNETAGIHSSGTESEKLENDGPPSLETEVLEPVFASTATNSLDEELTEKPKGDEVLSSVPEQKTPEIQHTVEQELAKIQPDKKKDDNKPKSGFLKHKRKPKFHFDDSVLFAPDIVLKKRRPEIKNHSHHPKAVSAVNHPGGQSQNFTKNETKPSQERQDRLLHDVNDKNNHKENVSEKQFSNSTQFMTKKLHRSNTTPNVQSDNVSKKKITTEKNKVKFVLYGSKNEHHRVQGRKFLPPATLTVTNACNNVSKNMNQSFPKGRRLSAPATLSTLSDYSDVISAKQKVHNQWSSMFIPQAKKTSPSKSPPKGEPPKKKTLKAHELLKSNMPALKNQMVQRKYDMSKSVNKH